MSVTARCVTPPVWKTPWYNKMIPVTPTVIPQGNWGESLLFPYHFTLSNNLNMLCHWAQLCLPAVVPCVGELCPQHLQNMSWVSCNCIWGSQPRLLIMDAEAGGYSAVLCAMLSQVYTYVALCTFYSGTTDATWYMINVCSTRVKCAQYC